MPFASHILFFLFRSRYIKKGPPKMEVIIPTGISIGWINILPIKSEVTNSAAPKIPLRGIICRLSLQPRIRMMWGATNPTNAIVPPADTTVATISAEKISKIFFTFFTSNPICPALSSPIASIFNSLEKYNKTQIEGMIMHSEYIVLSHEAKERLPIVQKTTCSILSLFNNMRKEITEARKYEVATPANRSESIDLLPFVFDKENTKRRVSKAPKKAKSPVVETPKKEKFKPLTIEITAPNAAPDDIPRV